MAKRTPIAPFGKWLVANGYTPARHSELAVHLKCSEGSIRQWARGGSHPRPDAIRKLVALTGLPVEAFLFPREWKAAA